MCGIICSSVAPVICTSPYLFNFQVLPTNTSLAEKPANVLLTQLIRISLYIEYRPLPSILDAVILQHAVVDPRVLAFDTQRGLGDDGLDDEVVVAVRAVLVGLLELLRVLAEALLALLARERHLEGLLELM